MAQQRYAPALFDRLIADRGYTQNGNGVTELSLEQVKDAVARDLESLLNTRVALPPGTFDDYPLSANSIVNYGLIDFAGMCVGSSVDRAAICYALKAAIERHEPRLRNVKATLRVNGGAGHSVDFAISALLQAHAAAEQVHFDAMLLSSTQQYSIRKADAAPQEGAG